MPNYILPFLSSACACGVAIVVHSAFIFVNIIFKLIKWIFLKSISLPALCPQIFIIVLSSLILVAQSFICSTLINNELLFNIKKHLSSYFVRVFIRMVLLGKHSICFLYLLLTRIKLQSQYLFIIHKIPYGVFLVANPYCSIFTLAINLFHIQLRNKANYYY